MREIVIINGAAESGKDTFVELVGRYIMTDVYSPIDDCKRILRMMGWDGAKTEASRKALSDLERLWTEYNDGPFLSCARRCWHFFYKPDSECKPDTELLFLMIQEPEEIAKIVDFIGELGCWTLLVRRPGHDAEAASNTSDRRVEEYDYDLAIDNDGTLENLEEKAKAFIEELRTKAAERAGV